MCPNEKKNETDGKRPAKTSADVAPPAAGFAEPLADLNEPLPAG